MGVGLAFNRPDISAIIGVGFGFLLMAIINVSKIIKLAVFTSSA